MNSEISGFPSAKALGYFRADMTTDGARLPGRRSLAASPLRPYLHRQRLHEILGVRQIALGGREINARRFHAVTGHDGVEDGFVFCGFQFSLHWDFD